MSEQSSSVNPFVLEAALFASSEPLPIDKLRLLFAEDERPSAAEVKEPEVFAENVRRSGISTMFSGSQISFLSRAADIYKKKIAVIYGSEHITYEQFDINVRRLASALIETGIKKGDTVSVMAPNIPAFLEANFAVPMAGAVLAKIFVLIALILFIQKRPKGLFALKGRAVEA